MNISKSLVFIPFVTLVACGSTAIVKPAEPTTTVTKTYWSFPGVVIDLVHCDGMLAQCYMKAADTCKENGFVAQTVDDHDIIMKCRPKLQPGDE